MTVPSLDLIQVLRDNEGRIARLERSNRRLRVSFGLVALLATIGFTRLPQASVADKISAKQFVLVDDKGNTCATWMSSAIDGQKVAGASMMFIGDDGLRLALSSAGGSPYLMMNGGGRLDTDKRLGHVSIGVSPEKGPTVTLWGQNTDKQGDALFERKTELRTCWGDNTHAVIMQCGPEETWAAP